MTESGKVVAVLAYAHAHGHYWPHLSQDSVSVLGSVLPSSLGRRELQMAKSRKGRHC